MKSGVAARLLALCVFLSAGAPAYADPWLRAVPVSAEQGTEGITISLEDGVTVGLEAVSLRLTFASNAFTYRDAILGSKTDGWSLVPNEPVPPGGELLISLSTPLSGAVSDAGALVKVIFDIPGNAPLGSYMFSFGSLYEYGQSELDSSTTGSLSLTVTPRALMVFEPLSLTLIATGMTALMALRRRPTITSA